MIAVLNRSKYTSQADDDDEEDTYEGGVDEPVDEREFEEMEEDVDSPDYDDADDDDDCAAEKITLDRFKLALKYEQKQVARPTFIANGFLFQCYSLPTPFSAGYACCLHRCISVSCLFVSSFTLLTQEVMG